MSGKKYQIFISSTYTDLKEARDTVTKAILNFYHIPIGMEMFSADNNEQWDTIKTTIESSDYYVLIIGHRYGTETHEGISYTEKEFDYAKEIGLPILAFIRNRNASTTPSQRDKEQTKTEKLDAFISKASSNTLINSWEDEKDLAINIIIALTKAFTKYSRIGWMRANEGMSHQVSEEIAVLSKENRELKIQLQEFKDKQQTRLPNLEIFFNGKEEIVETLVPDHDLIKNSKYYLKEILSPPQDLQRFIDTGLLQKYNTFVNVHSPDLEEYNKEVLFFERIKRAKLGYRIDVANTGTTKANNVVLELESTDTILVLTENSTKNKFKRALPPGIPENPIAKARRFKQEYDDRDSDFLFLDSFVETDDYDETKHQTTHILKVFDKSITIKLDHILHTQFEQVADRIYLIPLKIGTSQLKVKIICEEFHKPVTKFIPITITE